MESPLLTHLREAVLVADGAMGTMLYQRGVYIHRCFDELNLSQPALVEEVHRAYIAAGAGLIETNTFGANQTKLIRHGLEAKTTEINREAVRIARRAVRDSGTPVFIAGAIGPLGSPLQQTDPLPPSQIKEIYLEQVHPLVEEGVDCIIVETISHIEEMIQAIGAVREISSLPIIAQMTYTEDGTTLYGLRPEEIGARLIQAGADVVGANCSIGPRPMLDVLERLSTIGEALISAQPNAGSPQRVEGRYIYFCSPEYMASHARRFVQGFGVRLVGGCCGTTPDHIRAVASAIHSLQPRRAEMVIIPSTPAAQVTEAVPFAERSSFAAKLAAGQRVVSIEVNPPRGTDISKVLRGARSLLEAGADAVNIPDGPRASARISSLALSALIDREVGIDVLLHYCCRDRNLLGMQSDLLGAHALGLRNLILITGDPPKLGDYPNATAVFDVDSIGLTHIVNQLNHGRDLAGSPIGPPTAFAIGVGVNPAAMNLDDEIHRLRRKIDAGAEYILTQPIFDSELLGELLRRTEDLPQPVLVGILPLTSHRNAEFYHNEVPGMSIPTGVRERLRSAGSGGEARRVGVEIARESLAACLADPRVRGAYVMPPLGKYEMAIEVIAGFFGGAPRA